jgi:hypothetical protein
MTGSEWRISGNTVATAVYVVAGSGTVYALRTSTWSIRDNYFTTTCGSCAVVEFYWPHVVDSLLSIVSSSRFEISANDIAGGGVGIYLYYVSYYASSSMTISGASALSLSCNRINATAYGILQEWLHQPGYEGRYESNTVSMSGGSAYVLSSNVFRTVTRMVASPRRYGPVPCSG